ncbi:MAG: FimV family protein [Burkholderiales bacterium]|jgi:pilus assembly protein FimV
MSFDRLIRLVAVLAVLAFSLPAAGPAHAARLGAMSVLSERGQPFRAEVDVEDAADAVSAEPAIVSAETYRDLGLTLPASLRGARVTMARRDSDGRPVVRIQGTVPTEGPELIVVMSLGTSAGRHLRSYRLDLDSPVTGGAPRAAAPPPADPPALPGRAIPGAAAMPPLTLTPDPARMEPPRDVPRVEALPPPSAVALPSSSSMPSSPVAAAPRPAAPAARSPEPTRAEPATVTLAQGDTAASIANRIRPADVTEAQAVMALHRNNPSAFAGSVYRPRVGATLRLPDADQMRALPSVIAEEALRAQARAPAEGSRPVLTAERGGDRLSLTAGGTGRGKQSNASGGAANRAIAIDAAMSEARSRVQQLESIVQGLNKLIEERDRQIAAVSGQLKLVGAAVAPAAAPASVQGMSVPPANAQSPLARAAAPSDVTPPLGAAAATMLPAPTRRVAPPPPPPPEPDPWYMDPMVLGAVGVVVLLLGFLVIRWRGGGRRLKRGTGRYADAR